ncbi:response regulator [Paraburkholderia sp. UCT31]|uniref:response regulator n=1 Tax=Paraburkholderia sp. UCT31 TaxID=2615209 RepID=UPI00292A590F|nr:response regulator [Paraburkholderia sp. UCT31]
MAIGRAVPVSKNQKMPVYETFTQSASARKRATGGLGIGLAVVKHLVTAHIGTVAIASAGEGQGTVSPQRILLVDDSADATEALGTWLELQGHEVKRATNGPDALAIVKSFSPDVALIDIAMPGVDGPELAQLLCLRAQCSQTKLVALTGSNCATSMPAADERMFDAFLIKPLSLNDLALVLRA